MSFMNHVFGSTFSAFSDVRYHSNPVILMSEDDYFNFDGSSPILLPPNNASFVVPIPLSSSPTPSQSSRHSSMSCTKTMNGKMLSAATNDLQIQSTTQRNNGTATDFSYPAQASNNAKLFSAIRQFAADESAMRRTSLSIPVSERRKFFERVAEYNTLF